MKKKVTPKKLTLPSRAEIEKMLSSMERAGQHGGWGTEAAFLCRFLMMSGARIGEISMATWSDVDWKRKSLHLRGYKTETSNRWIPLFNDLEILLRKLIEWRSRVANMRVDKRTFLDPVDRIFRIGECQKSIDAACVEARTPRMTHHDFRHLFATLCIEAGVDIPTVAGWLGHSDGGVLAMKTYGHLRMEHSHESARKVRF